MKGVKGLCALVHLDDFDPPHTKGFHRHHLRVGPGALVELCPGHSVPLRALLWWGSSSVTAMSVLCYQLWWSGSWPMDWPPGLTQSCLTTTNLSEGLVMCLNMFTIPRHMPCSGTVGGDPGWRDPCPADFHIRLSSLSFMGTTGSYCSPIGRDLALQKRGIQKRVFLGSSQPASLHMVVRPPSTVSTQMHSPPLPA